MFTHESQINILKIKSWIRCKSQCTTKQTQNRDSGWTQRLIFHTNAEHSLSTTQIAVESTLNKLDDVLTKQHKNAFCTMATGLASRFKSRRKKTHSRIGQWPNSPWIPTIFMPSTFTKEVCRLISTHLNSPIRQEQLFPAPAHELDKFVHNCFHRLGRFLNSADFHAKHSPKGLFLSLNFEFISEFAFHTYCVCGTFRNHAI